jgi:hypothetical protein
MQIQQEYKAIKLWGKSEVPTGYIEEKSKSLSTIENAN